MALAKDRQDWLGEQGLFAAAGEAALARLAGAAHRLSLAPGQLVFGHGEDPDAAYVVETGTVSVSVVDENGQETHLADLGPGAVFGELAVLDGGPRTADVTASGPACVWRLPGEVFLAAVREDPDFALSLLRDLVAKMRVTDVEIENRRALPLGARVAKFLLTGGGAPDGEAATLRMTQAQIADRLAASREAVNRHLRGLEEEGVVALGRGRVTVKDAAALRAKMGAGQS